MRTSSPHTSTQHTPHPHNQPRRKSLANTRTVCNCCVCPSGLVIVLLIHCSPPLANQTVLLRGRQLFNYLNQSSLNSHRLLTLLTLSHRPLTLFHHPHTLSHHLLTLFHRPLTLLTLSHHSPFTLFHHPLTFPLTFLTLFHHSPLPPSHSPLHTPSHYRPLKYPIGRFPGPQLTMLVPLYPCCKDQRR